VDINAWVAKGLQRGNGWHQHTRTTNHKRIASPKQTTLELVAKAESVWQLPDPTNLALLQKAEDLEVST
jgi:hypothetical protein